MTDWEDCNEQVSATLGADGWIQLSDDEWGWSFPPEEWDSLVATVEHLRAEWRMGLS